MKPNKIDLKKFQQDAIRTESKIDNVIVNEQLLINALVLFSSAGQILDQIKKHVFYKKEYDPEQLNSTWLLANSALDDLKGIPLSGQLNESTIDINPRVFHAIIGIATEATELVEALQSQLMGNELDIVNVLEENGDIAWYQAIMMDELDGDWVKTLNAVIAKLKLRYPEKFTNDKAINRDLIKEREGLERDTK